MKVIYYHLQVLCEKKNSLNDAFNATKNIKQSHKYKEFWDFWCLIQICE